MTTLDRAHFEHLYLNANSIAEIAFLRALDNAASAPSQPTPEQRATVQAFQHQLDNPDPATFDWSALEGVYGFDGPLDAAPSEAIEPAPVRVPSFDEMVGFDDDEDLDAPVDIARYLQRVDAARPSLQSRIDDCFARADIAALETALESALATLPAGSPPLTAPLSADAFTAWLELYERHDEGMQRAVSGIRQLEPLLQG